MKLTTLVTTPYGLVQLFNRIYARLKSLEARPASNSNIIPGIGNPNGVQSATGAAIYLDKTDPNEIVWYIKTTTGTSNNEWVGP